MFDYLDCDADLSASERALRDEAREFVDESVRPVVDDHYLAGTFPEELIPEMGERGFFAPTLDGYGSPDVSERAYGLLMRELEAGDSGMRSMASVQGALAMYPIHAYGSAAQRDRWLPALGRGEAVGCFALTEPAHGSDPSEMETHAVRDGDDYVLSGHKRWVTNGPIADVAVVWARDRSAPEDPVRGFLVDPGWEGVETSRIEGKLSLRASVSGEMTFEDVRVPADRVLPDAEGLGAPLSCLTQARYGIVWGAVGMARDCLEAAREYATEREQFGRPIGGFQLQQEKLADAATDVTTAQLLADRLADLKERGELRHQQVSMGKRNNVAVARDVARTAREMLGAEGVTTAHAPMRHLANVEAVYTYEGTHDVHTLVLGKDLTGLDAFR